jgi:hypothetical protein
MSFFAGLDTNTLCDNKLLASSGKDTSWPTSSSLLTSDAFGQGSSLTSAASVHNSLLFSEKTSSIGQNLFKSSHLTECSDKSLTAGESKLSNLAFSQLALGNPLLRTDESVFSLNGSLFKKQSVLVVKPSESNESGSFKGQHSSSESSSKNIFEVDRAVTFDTNIFRQGNAFNAPSRLDSLELDTEKILKSSSVLVTGQKRPAEQAETEKILTAGPQAKCPKYEINVPPPPPQFKFSNEESFEEAFASALVKGTDETTLIKVRMVYKTVNHRL